MALLKKASLEQAFGKVGILGFAGSGKSFTAANIAVGICHMACLRQVAYFDTETGSDFLIKKFEGENIELLSVKSRSFSDLLSTIKECQANKISVLIIDSITHVWRDLCDSYDKKLNRRGRMQFQDWAVIKKEWATYTEAFINSPVHIIVCGRAGYDYNYEYDEQGNKDLVKTDVKMKVETEFGFEPSLVLDMVRTTRNEEEISKLRSRAAKQTFQPKEGSQWIHRCHVLKDRFDLVNGQSFDYPTFDAFKPHFEALNIGGKHVGYDSTRTSEDRFDNEGRFDWQKKQTEKKILLEEIQSTLLEKYPSTSAADKSEKMKILKEVFKTGSWTAVENAPNEKLQEGLDRIRIIINPMISKEKIAQIHALFKERMDERDHDTVRDLAGNIAGIDGLKSMKDLTMAQAMGIVKHLQGMGGAEPAEELK